jgi:lysozyme family protein
MSYPDLFLKCLKVVLKAEGGYSNHPSDPGGATNFGITQVVYDVYRAGKSLAPKSVREIAPEEVQDIFFSKYWKPMNLDGIRDDDLILQLFDAGINTGIKTAIKLIQRLIGVVDDGVLGVESIRAINEYNGNIIADFSKRRKLFYVTLTQNKPNLKVFLKGWLSRVDNCHF